MPLTSSPSSVFSISAPHSISFAVIALTWSGTAFLIRISPLVIAAATMNVPVSILSGIIPCLQLPSLATPSILMVSVPAPLTFAPILFRKFARSTISGSSAAFSIMVVPSASTAAIIMFSVAPTLGKSRYMDAPRSLSHDISTKDSISLFVISAPMA